MFRENEELETTTQDTWQQCGRQADLANAREFSRDDATQQCVVNKADTPCITTLDVVNAVREKSVFGEPRPDATGTDLRAWIGQSGELGAAAMLQDVVTAPQVLDTDFVCMPKAHCFTRDVHGRCISLATNPLSGCHFVPMLTPRTKHPCAESCDGTNGAAADNDLINEIRGSINQCTTLENNKFNLGASVDAFLDETHTGCALHRMPGRAGPMNIARHGKRCQSSCGEPHKAERLRQAHATTAAAIVQQVLITRTVVKPPYARLRGARIARRTNKLSQRLYFDAEAAGLITPPRFTDSGCQCRGTETVSWQPPQAMPTMKATTVLRQRDMGRTRWRRLGQPNGATSDGWAGHPPSPSGDGWNDSMESL